MLPVHVCVFRSIGHLLEQWLRKEQCIYSQKWIIMHGICREFVHLGPKKTPLPGEEASWRARATTCPGGGWPGWHDDFLHQVAEVVDLLAFNDFNMLQSYQVLLKVLINGFCGMFEAQEQQRQELVLKQRTEEQNAQLKWMVPRCGIDACISLLQSKVELSKRNQMLRFRHLIYSFFFAT